MEAQTYRGVVQRGKGKGAALGYKTANIPLDGTPSGIFAARVKILDDEAPYRAAVFADPSRGLLEAHILDFDDDLYGCDVAITLLEKIRNTREFRDDEKLRAAIQDDISRIREYFAR